MICPIGHAAVAEHAVEPSTEYVPGAHGPEHCAPTSGVVAPNVPAGHLRHTLPASMYSPATHVVAVAVDVHVLGYVSEKPAAHAVQMPPAAPAVQVAQSREQNAHVPVIRIRRDA